MTLTPERLDVDVSRRQAFGSGFDVTARDRRLADDLLSGLVTMSPHPQWAVPEDIDWSADPFTQRNWRAQLHMLRWLDPLRRVALGGDDAARERWWHHVSGWLSSDHSHIREFAWMDMIDGVRAKALVLGYPLVPEEERERYVEALHEHGSWLADHAHRGHSNHALHQLIGLFLIGRLLRQETWWRQAEKELGELFLEQYDEEGINAEGALAYHLLNYRWWKGTLEVLEVEGCTLAEVERRLGLARLGIVHATRPDGLMEMVGDTARTPMRDRDCAEMLYVATRGAQGSPPSEVFRSYNSGYVFGRSGWGALETDFDQETFYSVMHGTGIKVHGHDEAGAVTYYSRGRPWLVDSGKYAYVKDAFRAYFNSRAAHNVVTLRGERRDKNAAVALTQCRHSSETDDLTLVDHGYRGIKVRRRVVFHRPTEALVVLDSVQADREVEAVQQWQVGKHVKVEAHRSGYRLSDEDRAVHLVWAGKIPEWAISAGGTDPLGGWVSEAWMEADPAPQVLATKRGRSFRFVTIIAPEKDGDFAVEKALTLTGGIGLMLRQGGRRHSFSIMRDGVQPGLVNDSLGTEAHDDKEAAALRSFDSVRHALPPSMSTEDVLAQARQSVGSDDSEANRERWAAALIDRLPDRSRIVGGADGLLAGLVDVLGHEGWADLRALLAVHLPRRLPALGVVGRELPSGTYDDLLLHAESDALHRLGSVPEECVLASSVAGELVMPWIARGGDGDSLVVRLHGALNRTRVTLPAVPGMGSAQGQAQPYLVVQDPALDLRADMTLAWYAGSPAVDGHVILAQLVDRVRLALGIRDVLVVGSSGGGFAALHVASMLSHCRALAFNPQTDLRAYHRTFADRAAGPVFGRPTMGEVDDVRVSVLERWARSAVPDGPHALIVSNTQDGLHSTKHVRPFVEQVRERGLGEVSVREVDQGPGHKAVPAVEVNAWISEALGSG